MVKARKQSKGKSDSEVVAVKLEGPFAEWYIPGYEDPYGEDAGYTAYYDKHILPYQPVYGPPLGNDKDAKITNDLRCLADRLSCVCPPDDWLGEVESETDGIENLFKAALATGGVIKCCIPGDEEFVLTPYRRKDLPPVNKSGLKIYGKFAKLVLERVKSI